MKTKLKDKKIRRVYFQEITEEEDLKKKIAKIQLFAQQCRLDVFEMLYKRGNGHWGGSASSAELLATLYCHILDVDPENPQNADRDRLILSKGHAAPMLYTLLAHRGFFPVEELSTFRELNSRLQGHPCMNKTPGVDLSTGPLGHGISVGVGMALAARLQNKKYWTFVIVGEGCLNEGQSWEAIMSAAKFKPARLVIMVDYNKVQLDGASEDIMPLDPLLDKFKAFNLNVSNDIYDGHQVTEIIKSWEWIQQNQEHPCVVIYKTHKGKGVSFMEDNHKWHGSTIDDESFLKGRDELITTLENFSL
ncbi:MAG TPA: transketolase [Bacteroidales bacterium]|nr:transketolase [Bacteroidales bacterium]